MKKGYFELDFLLLFVYIGWNLQFAMARHAHHHRMLNSDCIRCPPGYGVERHCNRLHDTECGACAPDHYSSHFSSRRPCYPCSRCGSGLYIAHKCTSSRDTVCDSCHTYKGPHNEDFYERCVRPLLDNQENATDSIHSQAGLAKETESIVAVDLARGSPSFVVIASGVAIGALIMILLATCLVVSKRYQCRRVNHPYPYEAVATKDAVML